MVDVMVKTIMPHVIGMEATVVTMQILNGKNIMKFVILTQTAEPNLMKLQVEYNVKSIT